MKLLIVNADDFGLVDAANEGIVDAYLAGSVTSTTMMVNAPASERAALLAQRHPGLGVGLHFNLTWGRPLSHPVDVPALLDGNGMFLTREQLARRLLLGRVPAEQLRRELEAQAARLLQLGVNASHVDSHQHVHGFGRVFAVVAAHCASKGIPMRVPWVAHGEGGSMGRRLRRALLANMLSRQVTRWQGKVQWNDGLGSVFDLGTVPGEFQGHHYRRILDMASGQVFELMVHPVNSAEAMKGYTRIGAIGEAEWQYLRTGSLSSLASEAGFRLGSYRDLPAC